MLSAQALTPDIFRDTFVTSRIIIAIKCLLRRLYAKDEGGVPHVAAVIEEYLEDRDTGLSKPQRIGLADLTAPLLVTRSMNTSELANVPKEKQDQQDRKRHDDQDDELFCIPTSSFGN